MGVTLLSRCAIAGSAYRGPAAILIIDGMIADVVHGALPTPPEGCDTYDLAGRTVMPGMVLGHFHAPYHRLGALPLPVGMDAPPALHALRAGRTMARVLDHGITGVVSAGAAFGIDASLKLAMAEGVFSGPRMVAGSRDISTTGHSQDNYLAWYWASAFDGAVVCANGVEAVRQAVREEVKRGAEIIKLFVTGGHGVATPNHRMEMTADELRTAIDTAHERGVRARGHIANREAIMLAVEMGIDVVDHGDGLDEACIELMARNGTFLVPSMLFPKRAIAQNPGSPRSAGMIRESAAMIPMLHKAQQAGVRIVLGDDYGSLTLPHGDYADELLYYVEEAGLRPGDVLDWATRHGGEMLGLDQAPGVIARGRPADLLVLDGDPVADIGLFRQTANIRAVMVGGKVERGNLAIDSGRTREFASGAAEEIAGQSDL